MKKTIKQLKWENRERENHNCPSDDVISTTCGDCAYKITREHVMPEKYHITFMNGILNITFIIAKADSIKEAKEIAQKHFEECYVEYLENVLNKCYE